jgi:hypothetical protein
MGKRNIIEKVITYIVERIKREQMGEDRTRK